VWRAIQRRLARGTKRQIPPKTWLLATPVTIITTERCRVAKYSIFSNALARNIVPYSRFRLRTASREGDFGGALGHRRAPARGGTFEKVTGRLPRTNRRFFINKAAMLPMPRPRIRRRSFIARDRQLRGPQADGEPQRAHRGGEVERRRLAQPSARRRKSDLHLEPRSMHHQFSSHGGDLVMAFRPQRRILLVVVAIGPFLWRPRAHRRYHGQPKPVLPK
jgi:hypothetical protein